MSRLVAACAVAAIAIGGACAADGPARRTPTPARTSTGVPTSATPRTGVPTPGSAPTGVPATPPPLEPRPVPSGTPVPVPAGPPTTPPLSLVPREVSRGALDRRELALTFDCGGHAGPTREILETLRRADVRATFFMIGDWVRAYPELARDIAARHEIAHHSDHHPDYPSLSDSQIAADLEGGERAFIEVMGRGTKPLWRAPSGARDARVLAAAARAGWPVHVFWTQERDTRGELVTGDSGDWRDFTAERVAANLERAADLGNGVITVSHCDSEQTRVVLGAAIEAIRARGLRFVTVSELLRGASTTP